MEDGGYRTQDNPVDVFPGRDPDLIGNHLKKLHVARNTSVYKDLGEEVEVSYKKRKLPNGKTRVRVVVDHKQT